MVCVFVVLSFCGASSLLREGFFFVILGLRLYLFLLVGEVWWFILLVPSSIFIVSVVVVQGLLWWLSWVLVDMYCGLCIGYVVSFVVLWFCSRLWYSSYVPTALYRLL